MEVVKRFSITLFCLSPLLYAGGEQKINDVTLPSIVVQAKEELNELTNTASEGTINAKQLQNRPILRPAEALETVPGLIVTQHSGDGKANQYFLRGFSLDHGTDFYTTVEGMPVNLPTHAHGQGYCDLNFLIPELISNIQYKKGPYFVQEGDFASTGSAHISYADKLPYNIASATIGSFGNKRALNAASYDVSGGSLLYALEYYHNDGPWKKPENYERFNGVVSYTKHTSNNTYKVTAMGYKGDWDATNHVPLRAIDGGIIDRFGSLDPSDGGTTYRYSLSAKFIHHGDDATTSANAYVINYGLDLFSNFTYYLDHPIQGDQFEQKDERVISGASLEHVMSSFIGGFDSIQTFGAQVRNDKIDVALYNTQMRTRFNTLTQDHVNETNGALYYQNELSLNDDVLLIAGVRGDLFRFDNKSDVNSADSNIKTAALLSPKLSLIFGPWYDTQIFINSGYGYHSNDARGVTKATNPATPLVVTKGAELGIRTEAISHLQSSLTFWMMDSESELVFAGDSGGTEPTGPARRLGIEWANYWTPTPWFILDTDFTFSQARYKDPVQAGGEYVPEAMEQTISIGAAVTEYKKFFGGMRLRYFGSKALIEDNSVRSHPSTLVNLKAARHLGKNFDLMLDVLNLFDAKTYDIEYYYTSQLKTESSPVDDYMVHPGEPRSLRLTLTYKY